jgi:hypothetical protein
MPNSRGGAGQNTSGPIDRGPKTVSPKASGEVSAVVSGAGVLLVAIGLTAWFFPILWLGGGLVGGDLYPYFMPQRTVYADALAEGCVPLWNSLVGHGYPQLAESQTGVFYPPNLLAYAGLEINAAYVSLQLGHYVLAFCGGVTLARVLGLSWLGSGLAALVLVYGWFPARLCLEWAITGGAWMPWALWAMFRWQATRAWKYAFILWGCLTLQLLAGHFVIAFITQLLVLSLAGLAAWRSVDTAGRREFLAGTGLAVLLAFAAASIQLVPTWEYKQLSQRRAAGTAFDPGYGAIPPRYLPQVLLPWSYYGSDSDINVLSAGASATNRVEAHLYFGLLPLGLLLLALCARTRPAIDGAGTEYLDQFRWPLVGLALLALIHATGVLGSLTSRLPGFGFFTGPGRFGLVTTLIVALLAGLGWDRAASLLSGTDGRRRWLSVAVGLGLFAVTVADLYWVASRVGYAFQVLTAPIEFRGKSPLRDLLATGDPVRLFCRGANVATILGVASTPTYLGLAPAAYSDPALTLAEPLPFDGPPTSGQIDWLRRAGVTHLLSFAPVDESAWPVRALGAVDDPLLNLAWGRYGGAERPLFYLYALQGTRGRVAWAVPEPASSARVVRHAGETIEIDAQSERGGLLVLTELAYPGWEVFVDGVPAQAELFEGMYRAVTLPAGPHRVVWVYRPQSVRIGGAISVFTLLLVACIGHVRFWHPRWTAWAGRGLESEA